MTPRHIWFNRGVDGQSLEEVMALEVRLDAAAALLRRWLEFSRRRWHDHATTKLVQDTTRALTNSPSGSAAVAGKLSACRNYGRLSAADASCYTCGFAEGDHAAPGPLREHRHGIGPCLPPCPGYSAPPGPGGGET